MNKKIAHEQEPNQDETSQAPLELQDEPKKHEKKDTNPKVSSAVVPEHKDSLTELIEKNIKWSQVIYNQNKKINHRLTWMVIGSYIRLALILAPIIIGLIFLPPLLQDLWKQYEPLLSQPGGVSTGLSEVLNLFQNSGIDASQVEHLLQQNNLR